jgi:hypothetical protein
VLHCREKNELYVGQAVNVVRRFSQHLKIHDDVRRISFKPVPHGSLTPEELRVIGALEVGGYALRNVAFASRPPSHPELDALITPAEQARWLRGEQGALNLARRADLQSYSSKYRRKFESLERMPIFKTVVDDLALYVRSCIPAPAATEYTYWAASCMPPYPNPGVTILSRINVNRQEVFTAFLDGRRLNYSLHVAKSLAFPDEKATRRTLAVRGVAIEAHRYPAGGADQVNIVLSGTSPLRRLLARTEIREAASAFNLWQMRKGACLNAASHCVLLADRIFAGIDSPIRTAL